MRFIQQQLTGFPGTHALYAVDDSLSGPMGFVWFRYPMWQVVELLYVFTHEDFRRQGVASGMLNWLKEQHPKATIAGGKVNDMSKDFCAKHGFIVTTNGYFLIPNTN